MGVFVVTLRIRSLPLCRLHHSHTPYRSTTSDNNSSAGILAFVDTRLTNAVAEGLNRIVRMVKNRASGFRTLDAFADMIFLCVGDLDIPAQIPARFRTL